MRFRRRISNIYNIPNRKRKLITHDFLVTFKEEIDKRIDKSLVKNLTYWGHYFKIQSTNEFHDAFRKSCEKHYVINSLYKYSKRLSKRNLESFDDKLLTLMIEKGIIEEGIIYDDISEIRKEDKNKIEMTENFSTSGWTIKEKEIIENILND